MPSRAIQTFENSIQDAIDLLNHFDSLNKQPPPAAAEVLKRASLVMALAALETYFEDRIVEAVDTICSQNNSAEKLTTFYKHSLEIELKSFHTPNTERVRALFQKYLDIDLTEGWVWNNCAPDKARKELNLLAKKRGDIAHRSLRPAAGQPEPHAVIRKDLGKHIHFIKELVKASDGYLSAKKL